MRVSRRSEAFHIPRYTPSLLVYLGISLGMSVDVGVMNIRSKLAA